MAMTRQPQWGRRGGVAAASIFCMMPGAGAWAQQPQKTLGLGYHQIDGAGIDLRVALAQFQMSVRGPFAVEAEIGFAFDDEVDGDELGVSGDRLEIDTDYRVGLYGLYRVPLADNGTHGFARIGYVRMRTDVEVAPGGPEEAQVNSRDVVVLDDALSMGGGIAVSLTERWGLRLEYNRLFGSDDLAADSYGVSATMSF